VRCLFVASTYVASTSFQHRMSLCHLLVSNTLNVASTLVAKLGEAEGAKLGEGKVLASYPDHRHLSNIDSA
jgi:hypothetical protein